MAATRVQSRQSGKQGLARRQAAATLGRPARRKHAMTDEAASMPEIKTDDGCTIHVEVEGREQAPVLMLSNSLGTNLHMWDEQVAPFTRHFRLVRYDRRGHGRSSVPKGPYTMERLGRDVLCVLDGLGIDKINWCGLSMGGMVGMWLGANAANRVDRLILSNTAAYFPDKTVWQGRIKLLREKGLQGIVDANMERWFTRGFRERSPQVMAKIRDMFLATHVDGYIACGEAIRDMDHRPLLSKITAPTLVIAGRHDPSTTLEAGEFIQEHVPGADIAVLDAAHISNLEQPQAYADTVLRFLLNK
jgi:3-oxoadipate enol-lactonase